MRTRTGRRRRSKRRRAAAGAREAGRYADLGHRLRAGASQGRGALRRRRQAPRQDIEEPVRTFEVLPVAGERRRSRARRDFERFIAPCGCVIAALAAAFVTVAALALFWRDIPVPLGGRTLGEVLAPGTRHRTRSIAVLPFTNMTGDSGVDYLGEGLRRNCMHRPSRVAGLRVAARRSAFAFSGKEVDARQHRRRT